jgi:hypothetical protein
MTKNKDRDGNSKFYRENIVESSSLTGNTENNGANNLKDQKRRKKINTRSKIVFYIGVVFLIVGVIFLVGSLFNFFNNKCADLSLRNLPLDNITLGLEDIEKYKSSEFKYFRLCGAYLVCDENN